MRFSDCDECVFPFGRDAFIRVRLQAMSNPFKALVSPMVAVLALVGAVGLLIGEATWHARRALFSGQGRRLGWGNLWAQMDRVGVRAIPIVVLVLGCIGAILALQTAPLLRDFGQLPRVADLIAVSVTRELGPLVAAVVLSGFAGAAIAAELGTMVVGEEIEALESHAINPIRFLVVPRVIATTVMMVCIAVVADAAGVIGGMLVGKFVLGIEFDTYLTRTFDMIRVRDFVTGLIKAAVFGAMIAGIACHLGLSVTGGAMGVGAATTRTVVYTIVALIAVDLLFTTGFYFLGW
jgi:phospholipid/cholesterol/gamma-HCH transport system permease protein